MNGIEKAWLGTSKFAAIGRLEFDFDGDGRCLDDSHRVICRMVTSLNGIEKHRHIPVWAVVVYDSHRWLQGDWTQMLQCL